VEPAATGAVGRQLQSALTNEVELVKHGELVAELVKLHQHDRRRESHRGSPRARPRYGSLTAWPTPTCRMSNSQPAASWLCMLHAACDAWLGVHRQVGLLQPVIGRK
jgi:hypothetical protein